MVGKCTGGCCRSAAKKMVVGGWGWAWWMVTDVQRLKLEVMTLNPRCEGVETVQGVPLTVTAIAQCKILTEKDPLALAAEQFLGKDAAHIKSVILQTLEGHLRAILGTLTVEEVYKDRETFASLVREVAGPDVNHMGIDVLSFTIKDVYDEVDYLKSLGKARTAAVKKEANIGVANAERDAGIHEAECEQQAMDAKYTSDSRVEESRRNLNLQKALFDSEVNAKKEEAKLAYELECARQLQKIRRAEMEIAIDQRTKLTEIESQEILRKVHELQATVVLPAGAEAYKLTTLAAGAKYQTLEEAKSASTAAKLVGEAEAEAMESVGRVEGERMKNKACAYKSYSDAALLSLTLEALPKFAAEISAPLAKTDEIVILGGAPSELSNLISSVPATVRAVTGTDVSKVTTDSLRILFQTSR